MAVRELIVGKVAVDDLLDQALDPGGGGLGQGFGGRLDLVGQHDQPGLLGLGFGAGIAEILFLDLLLVALGVDRLVKEEFDQGWCRGAGR